MEYLNLIWISCVIAISITLFILLVTLVIYWFINTKKK